MANEKGPMRSLLHALASTLALSSLALIAGACGKGIFSSSSSSSSGGGSTATARSVYVSNFTDSKISSLNRNSSGALTSPITLSGGSDSGPVGLAVTPGNTMLYAANAKDDLIYEFPLTSNGNLGSPSSIATGSNPQQPVLVPSGQYAYSINAGGSISEYTVDSSSGALANNTTSSTKSGLIAPISGVASNSYLYVTDQQTGNGVVLTFTIKGDGTLANGPSSTPSLGTPPGASAPNQIMLLTTTSPSHTWVFVSDAKAGRISLFKASGSGLTFINSYLTAAGTPNLAEAGLLAVKKGSNIFIYCADQTSDTISVFLFNPSLPSLTLTSASAVGALNTPTGLAHAGDFLYVTNNANGTVTRFDINTANGALTNPVNYDTENPANALSGPQSILITG